MHAPPTYSNTPHRIGQHTIGSLPTLLLQIELLLLFCIIILFVAPHPFIMIWPYMPTYLNINTAEMSQCREDTNQTPTPATNDDHLGPWQRRMGKGDEKEANNATGTLADGISWWKWALVAQMVKSVGDSPVGWYVRATGILVHCNNASRGSYNELESY